MWVAPSERDHSGVAARSLFRAVSATVLICGNGVSQTADSEGYGDEQAKPARHQKHQKSILGSRFEHCRLTVELHREKELTHGG